MNDKASTSNAARRTRRQLLAGGTGTLAAVLTAEALARPAPAAAADGGTVILGQANSETVLTTITNSTDGANVLVCQATGGGSAVAGNSDAGDGVQGGSNSGTGVGGISTSGDGISGWSSSGGRGVYGQSGNTFSTLHHPDGVHGRTDSASGRGVFAENLGGGTAIRGEASSTGDGVQGSSGSGGRGVYGQSGLSSSDSAGTGVHGVSDSAGGIGVFGENVGAGTGVAGSAHGAGAGVLAENGGGGPALQVSGIAAFSRSGVLTVAVGASSATQTGVALNSAGPSLVLATLQQDHSGVWVRSAVPNPATNSFTVHLNKAAPVSMAVAWFVAN